MSIFKKIARIFKGIFQSAVSRLWDKVKAEYPALVAEIKKDIEQYNSPEFDDMNGGEKGLAVATNVLELVPHLAPILLNLPDLKAFLVRGVADIYATEFKPALEREAEKLLAKL